MTMEINIGARRDSRGRENANEWERMAEESAMQMEGANVKAFRSSAAD